MRSLRYVVLLATLVVLGGVVDARVAYADDPAPEPTEEVGDTPVDPNTEVRGTQKAAPTPPVATSPGCKADVDCALGSICVDGECQLVRKQRRIIPPFYWHKPDQRSGYRYVPPFYFENWKHPGPHAPAGSPDRNIKVVPLLLFSHVTTPTETATRIWPLFWHTKYRENGKSIGAQTAMLPLFWWQNRKGRQVGAVPLLLSGWQRDADRDLTEGMVAGIGYYRREKGNAWRVLFPLYWDHEKPGSRLATLFPIFWYHRDGLKSQSVFFPVVWRFTNGEKGTEDLNLFPFFHFHKEHFGHRAWAISLLGGYERDVDAKRTQLVLLGPPFYHRRDPSLDLDVLLPIFARWKNHVTGSEGVVAGPVVHVADKQGSTTTVFPIYWRFADKKTQGVTHLLLPIGGYHTHPGAGGAVIGPAYGWRSTNGEGGWGGGLAPLLFMGRSGHTRHAALVPLFTWWRDDQTGKQITAVGPLFVRQNPPTHGVDVGLLPLLYFGKEDQRAYAYVAPIFWYRKSPDRTTVVAGPAYYDKKTNGDWAGGLAPLLFFGKKGDERYDVALPLFFRRRGPERSTTVVLPYVHDRHGATTTDVLFPAFYLKRSPEETILATPLGGLHRKDGKAFGLIGPYIYKADEARRSSTHVLFPIAFVRRSPDYDLTAVAPLFWQTRNGSERNTVFAPLFWHRRGSYTDVDALFPVFLRTTNAHASTFIVGPYFGRRNHDGHGWRQDGVLGLFSYGEKREGDKLSRFVGGPAFFYQRNDFTGVRRLLLGPVFDWRRPDGYTSGMFPVMWAWRRGNVSHVVSPFFYRHADQATGYSINVAGPIYWGHNRTVDGGGVHLGLFPIFFGAYGKDGTSKTAIFPLLYFAKKKVGTTLVTPVGGYSSYEGGYKVVVGPFYVRRDNVTHSGAFFPLIYHGVNQVTESSTTYVFPLYFDRHNKVEGTRLQAFTPLVWRYRNVEQAVTVGLPLIFDVHKFGESHTTAVLPFFLRHRSEVSNSTWWSAPPLLLWGRDRRGDDPGKDFVFFPLVWRFGGKERQTTIVAPFVWDFKRGDSRTTVVFPIMARWTRPDGDRLIVLNTYYRKGKGVRAGSWWLDFFPLFSFGRPRQQDFEWNIFEGLVGFSRQGRNRTLKLFWLIDISLQPLPASTISWWSNTPPEQRTSF